MPALSMLPILAAQAQPTRFQQFMASMMPMILIFVIMYLLLIRPQQKKAEEHRQMVKRLKAGDRVVTTGGIFGTITKVGEGAVSMRIADDVEIEVSRSAIATIRTAEPQQSGTKGR